MLARTHIATAILAGIVFKPPALPVSEVFAYFLIVIFFALLTDLDHPQSTVGQAFPILAWCTNKLLGHRGFFHTPMVPIVLWYGARSFGYQLVGLAILIGMLSHLFCDGLTKNGVNLLHPFAEFRIRGFIRTGGWMETLFFWIVAAGIVWQAGG